MNTIVNKLLDVDKEARQMLDEAQQYYERILAELEDEKEQLRGGYAEKAKLHIQALEAEQADEVEEVVARVRNRTAQLLGAMENRYDQLHEEWENTLVQRTIGSAR